jgi:hypothetical protein
MTHFIPCKQTVTAPQVARLFWREIVRHHGVPSSIVSDRDPRFTSHFWQELWVLLGTKLAMSTTYHPQTDGQTERMNRLMEEILRSYVKDNSDDWDEHLTAAEIAVNTSIQTSTNFTPFKLNYGREMHLPLELAVGSSAKIKNPAAAESLQTMLKDRESARASIAKAQERQAHYADQHRRVPDDFKVGDRVMLSTQDLTGWGKLMGKYIGPFSVISVLPNNTIELDLPMSMKAKHPRFNISKVKMFKSTELDFPERKQLNRPNPVLIEGEVEYYEVESILGKRKTRLGRSKRFVTEYLVKWHGYDVTEATWQSMTDLEESPLVMMEVEKFEQLQSK